MSPSWTSLSRLFAPRASLGVSLGRDRVRAVKLVASKEGARVEWVRQEALPMRLFGDIPTADTRNALAQAFTKLCAEAKTGYLPVQIALPDPAVSALVFELDEIPADATACEELARWRFAKALHLDAKAIACTTQALGEDQGKTLLLALAVDQVWLACLHGALQEAGVAPAVIDTVACHRFRHFHDALTEKKQDGALVSIDNEAWSISIWDAQGRLRFIRSRWRERMPTINDVAEEVERVLRAYARPGSGKSLGSIFVSGGADARGLSSLLDEVFHEPCVCLPTSNDGVGLTEGESMDSFEGALAAACLR